MALAQSKVDKPDSYNFNRGVEELNNEKPAEALDYFNKELQDNPKNGYAYFYIATIRHTHQEYGKALTAIDLALKHLPKKDDETLGVSHLVRAAVYLALEDTTRALTDLAASIKANPSYELAYKTRAQVYYERKQYAQADADYQQLLRLD